MAKTGIHPTYNQELTIQCICGKSHTVSGAATGPIKVESCPSCHPTYTGKKETKIVKGRIEKFLEKQKRIDALKNGK